MFFGALENAWASTNAQPEFSIRLWQTEEGLPQNEVLAITQSRNGYLWVGTREGLAKFDGISFTSVRLTDDLVQPKVLCVQETRDGSLWVGTDRNGLFKLNDRRFVKMQTAEAPPDNHILSMAVDVDGSLWVGSDNGLTRIKDGKASRILEKELQGPIRSLALDSEGRMWVGMNDKVLICEAGNITQNLRIAQLEFHGPAYSIFCESNGPVFVACAYGILHIQHDQVDFYLDEESSSGVASRIFASIFEDSHGNFWAGSHAGLSRMEGGHFTKVSGRPLDNASIYCVYEDREGNIWVGTAAGLVRMVPKQAEVFAREQGLNQDDIAAVLCAHDGSIWIGTFGGGVNQVRQGKVVYSSMNRTNNLSSEFVTTLCEAHNGGIWVGTDWAGLNQINNLHVSLRTFRAGIHIRSILEDHEERIWVGSLEGLYIHPKESDFEAITNFPGGLVSALLETPDGRVWIGSEKGLYYYENNGFHAMANGCPDLNMSVTSLYLDESRNLWIATRVQGLFLLQDGKLNDITSKQGLVSDSIFAIVEDNYKMVWFDSSLGIFSCSQADLQDVARGLRSTLTCSRHGRAEGISITTQPNDIGQPAACKDREGKLWFRSSFGVVVIDPGKIKSNLLAPPVFVESLFANDKPVLDAATVSDNGAPILLPPGNNKIEIKYTALSYRASENNRFRYRLAGADDGWIEAGGRRVAYYDNLLPGTYDFQVVACNNDGVWNLQGARLSLKLLPHFWQTLWFRILCLTTLLGAAALSARHVVVRRMEHQLTVLERKHAVEMERARIARDLHDDLGARLTELLMAQDRVVNRIEPANDPAMAALKKASSIALDLAGNLDAIVWAVDPQHDYLDSFVLYLYEYLDRLAESSSIPILRDVPASLPHIPLSSVQKHNLFLVIKEALNNAVKHSKATEIWLRLAVQHQTIEISIEDNGKGFTEQTSSELGNGLNNMRKRMQSINGTISIVTNPSQGAKITMCLIV